MPAPREGRLALVESNTSGTGRLFVRAAASLGLRPLLLAADPGKWGAMADEGAQVVRADTSDVDAILPVLRGMGPVAGVASSSEYFVAAAAEAAARLGCPGPSADAVRACRDKETQRIRLAAAGVGIPAFEGADTVDEAGRAAARVGLPAVLKPVEGSGSVGVRLCADAAEVRAHAAALLAARTNERGMPVRPRILVEARVDGPEFSVELFGGRVIGITAKHVSPPPWFVETGHDFPAPLPAAESEAVRRCAVDAARALGLGWGALHVELRLSAHGPVIVEVNPRLAGGFIPRVVCLATGIDLVEAAVRAAVGDPVSLAPTADRAASIRFVLPPRGGVLAGVEGMDRAASVPGVADARLYRALGDEVRRAGDFRDRMGHVIAVAATPAAARAAAEDALRHVRVRLRADAPVPA